MLIWQKLLVIGDGYVESRSGRLRPALRWDHAQQIAVFPDGQRVPYEEIEIEWAVSGHGIATSWRATVDPNGVYRLSLGLNRKLAGTPVFLRVADGPLKQFYQGHRSEELVETLKANGVAHTRSPRGGAKVDTNLRENTTSLVRTRKG